MRHSSTSSSDPSTGQRRWLLWGVLTLALFGALEALLRLPAVRDALPPRSHFYDQSIAVRQDALDRAAREHGRIDVLFVGSSIVRTNLHPLLFDALMAAYDRRVVSFNAGLSGLWPSSVALYLEHLWLPSAQPKIVVQGVRYPELAASTHALRPEQVVTGAIEAGWLERSVAARVKSAIVSRTNLLHYHGVLTSGLDRWATGAPGPWIELEGGVPIDERGHTPRLRTLAEVRRRGLDDGRFDSSPWCLPDGCDLGFDSLAHAIEASRTAGARYVLLNVPEHASRWQSRGPEKYRQYIAALREFASRHGVLFLDPTDGDPQTFADDAEYSDTYHMSPAGAERLTQFVAEALAREMW